MTGYCARCHTHPHGHGKGGQHCWTCAQALTVHPWKVAR